MPLTWTPQGEYLVITARGKWHLNDLLELLQSLVPSALEGGYAGVLMDDRESIFDPPTDDLRRFGESIAPIADSFGKRVAVVVDSDLQFGIARIAAAISPPDGHLDVFKEMDAAWTWLRNPDSLPV
jgi:hypothetical protein